MRNSVPVWSRKIANLLSQLDDDNRVANQIVPQRLNIAIYCRN